MPPIYDHAGSLRRMGNDPELFQEMAALLRSDAPRWLVQLQQAVREAEPARIRHAAHTLKGLAANFGAARAVAAAAQIEDLARAQQTFGLPAAVEELEEALSELISAVPPALEASRLS